MATPENQANLGISSGEPLEEVRVRSVQVIFIREGENGPEIVLGHRISGAFRNQWTAPGGKIDEGESDEDTAIREVEEETGAIIKKQDLRFFKPTNSSTRRKKYNNAIHNYAINVYAYTAPVEGLLIYNKSLGEFDKMKWVPIDYALDKHKQAVAEAKKNGIIEPDKIPNALAPKTFEIIEMFSRCPGYSLKSQ